MFVSLGPESNFEIVYMIMCHPSLAASLLEFKKGVSTCWLALLGKILLGIFSLLSFAQLQCKLGHWWKCTHYCHIGLWCFWKSGSPPKFRKTPKRSLYTWCYSCFRLHAGYFKLTFVGAKVAFIIAKLNLGTYLWFQEKLDMGHLVKLWHISYHLSLYAEIILMKNHF